MIFTLFGFIILSILRAIIVTRFDISPFTGAHQWLLIPDIAFLGIIAYWIFKLEKRKITLPIMLFFLAYLGSILWDYQSGFYWLKFLVFPGVLYVIAHPEKYNNASLRQTIAYSFPILHAPFVSIKQFTSELFNKKTAEIKTDAPTVEAQKTNESLDTISFSLSKAIWFGVGLGLIILIILASLDPDFASFLQLTKWWDVIVDSFGSFLYYMFVFFWYFWKPLRTTWEEHEYAPSINTILHRAVVMIVGIFVGYTFYDAYIILRALHLIKLAFETVGRNTQMNFLELVILGGGWLFLTAFLLNTLKNKIQSKKSTVATVFLLLLISCIWLIPPVINILRVLLTVYIPRFGLTARRLFGIYTTIAFTLTFIYVLWGGIKKDTNYFTKVTITFFLSIILMSFVVPTNLVIAQWHFSRYVQNDTKADFNYFKKLKLEKWGWLFYDKLDGSKYKSDNVWGLALAERTNDKEKQKEYKEYLKKQTTEEVNDMVELINAQQTKQLEQKYGFSPRKGNSKAVTSISIEERTLSILERYNRDLESDMYMSREYDFNPITFNINAEMEQEKMQIPFDAAIPTPTSGYIPNYKTSSYFVAFNYATYRTIPTLLIVDKNKSSVLPF